ncbi:hypothetical protein GLOIN_2v1669242 [Rhizophagus irregularis DAOM 181602=DAOM 197198]|uniref:Uncharacterized protein n=1 Tax=Rhizophagus irregularis (strain DAOM 181602 / DAOM 197198 / MUCL 43194) TaxID=747089 RepID=A0A2P4PID5_RHIID|nr:hypothetical protein GLOIN_2v1669242 [Rhizophagus irregularis DAOM 181602=DAOM 197198]POG65156.1 hypothetical protein GLOIN_2v1669242 [Rhizophagus irregularis DAOM 181602=DAOM 197198]|eukprot:XP_025172022.1 hypothetical protein GLOIN_2v1669242 [Rhizophagus irregularis DAOM 181602=DAOM 197198]
MKNTLLLIVKKIIRFNLNLIKLLKLIKISIVCVFLMIRNYVEFMMMIMFTCIQMITFMNGILILKKV